MHDKVNITAYIEAIRNVTASFYSGATLDLELLLFWALLLS